MGWFSDLARETFGAIARVGRAVVEAAKPVVQGVLDASIRAVKAVEEALRKEFRSPPKTERERLERELEDVNDRVQYLRARHLKNEGLTDAEKKQWRALREQRGVINQQLQDLDGLATAEDIVSNRESFAATTIDDDNTHVLQYHVGQSTYNRTCECGRPMVLQWKRRLKALRAQDFYWGCSGYYLPATNGESACAKTAPLAASDLDIFANLRRPEFHVPAVELASMASGRGEARLRDALESVRDKQGKRRTGVELYRCPFHGEALRLRRKKEPEDDFLDEYFLGCPRYLRDKTGCNFLVKLKSPAQISAVLNAEQMNGLIGTVH